MGGRGSSGSGGGSSGIYAGRFSGGTSEELARAERNLSFAIAREKQAIKNSPTGKIPGWESHKPEHQATLKALTQQMNELQKEKKRREKR